MKKHLVIVALLFCCNVVHAQNFEQRMLLNLQDHRLAHPGMTSFMQGVSNSTNDISLAIPVSLFVVGAIRHDKDMKIKAVAVAGSIVVETIVELSLKYTINRARPSTDNPNIIPASDHGSPSFPSGHASQAFATAAAVSIAYPKWYVIAPSFLWAGTVGFSRMYLGVHYPTDILAGAIVGSGSAWLAYKINKWIFYPKHKSNKLSPAQM